MYPIIREESKENVERKEESKEIKEIREIFGIESKNKVQSEYSINIEGSESSANRK